MPVAKSVLVMPLVGPLDETRRGRIEEALWLRVAEKGAVFVILDLAGAKDDEGWCGPSAPADRPGREAPRGARVVITGVRADVARALVAAEVDVSDLIALGPLENAIAYALRRWAPE